MKSIAEIFVTLEFSTIKVDLVYLINTSASISVILELLNEIDESYIIKKLFSL